MANENDVVVVPEDAVEVVQFGDDGSSPKDTAVAVGVIGGAAAGGFVLAWALSKLRKKIHEAKIAKYQKRKEEEAEIEAELKRRQEESNTDEDEQLDD